MCVFGCLVYAVCSIFCLFFCTRGYRKYLIQVKFVVGTIHFDVILTLCPWHSPFVCHGQNYWLFCTVSLSHILFYYPYWEFNKRIMNSYICTIYKIIIEGKLFFERSHKISYMYVSECLYAIITVYGYVILFDFKCVRRLKAHECRL